MTAAPLTETLVVQEGAAPIGPLCRPVHLVTPDGAEFAGAAGRGVESLALTANADGKVTGGTLTFDDGTTSPVSVATA